VIFVTVGHQMPFDRLIRAVDEWAGIAKHSDVFAQVGNSSIQPQHIQFQQFMSPDEFRQRMSEASAIVGHAGTGTIIAALQYRKPLLVLPRLAKLGETRNDHQIPTARYFSEAGFVLAAIDEADVISKMDEVERFAPPAQISDRASPQLLQTLREFAFNGTQSLEVLHART
jgi:UDP-N-acetylglucosamine transferase subunit ALG13